MFSLIAQSSKLPERFRIIGDRLFAQLNRRELKEATQNDVDHSKFV